jgi:hypothetical protein
MKNETLIGVSCSWNLVIPKKFWNLSKKPTSDLLKLKKQIIDFFKKIYSKIKSQFQKYAV